MKRVLCTALLVLLLSFVVSAQDTAAPVFDLAAYVPADVALYAGLRIDDGTIATIDDLIAKIAGFAAEFDLPIDEIPTIRDILGTGVITPEDVDLFFAGTGDMLAIGNVQHRFGTTQYGVMLTPVEDRDTLASFLTNIDLKAGEALGRYTSYSNTYQTALLSDELLIVINGGSEDEVAALANGDYPRLSSSDTFTATIADLPLDDYIAGFYGAVREGNSSDMMPFVSAAVGVTLQGGETITLDVALNAGETLTALGLPTGSIDPSFRQVVPADSMLMSHGVGLGEYLEVAINSFATQGSTAQETRKQIDGLLAGFGLNLDELIAWTSSDYVVFGRVDVLPLITMLSGDMSDIADIGTAVDVGVAIKTNNPEASAKLVHALTSLVRIGANAAEEVTLSEETIGDAAATVITLTLPTPSGDMTFKAAIASNDEVFVLGTYNAVTASLTQASSFNSTPLAQAAARDWLPDAQAVFVVDGKLIVQYLGFIYASAAIPIVGTLYDNTMAVTPEPVTPAIDSETITPLLARASEMLRHATVSTRTTDDAMLLRITVAIGE